MRQILLLVLAVAIVAACTHSTLSLEEPPPASSPASTATPTATSTSAVGYGDGRDGSPALTGVATVNECVRVLLGTGSTIAVGSGLPPAVTGDVFVLVQMQDDVGTAGDASPFSAVGNAGVWELIQVASSTPSQLTTQAPLAHRYDSTGTHRAQACSVPQYAGFPSVTAGALVTTVAWNGTSGGITAMIVSGTLQLDGIISASYRGYRPGASSSSNACLMGGTTALTTTSIRGGGKGEGIDARAISEYGRGNLANGGGGGNECSAGGGGGGLGGAGGTGGLQLSAFPNGNFTDGLAGSALSSPLPDRMFPGGAGGGGHAESGTPADAGGTGGGIVLLIARHLAGSGTLRADGESAPDAAMNDGGGGGGAGGTILLYTSSGSWSGQIHAEGGNGASTNTPGADTGPGGGGGGGRVYAPGVDAARIVLTGGAPGINLGSTSAHGATAGAVGIFE